MKTINVNEEKYPAIPTGKVPKDRKLKAAPSFSPGPWMYRPNPGSTKEDWTFHIDRQGTPGRMNWGILIAACWGHVRESAEANARLIAAAPALYEAVQLALNNGYRPSDTNQDDGDKVIEAKMRAALALVEG